MTAKAAGLALLMLASLTGCFGREGRNSDCRWPGEPDARVLQDGEPEYGRHLRADAEFAEELAIRYMDARHGPRSGKFESHKAAAQAKNQCLGALFGEIGKTHGVAPQEVFRFLGQRSLAADVAMNLPLVLIYGLLAAAAARRLQGRYPIEDGWVAAAIIVLFSSVAFAAGAVILGEAWSILAEMARVGNGHLSNRADRLPWVTHRSELFAMAVVLFSGVAARQYRHGNTNP